MPSVEELLNNVEEHVETYAEENEELVIDAETRVINIPESEVLFGVKGDKNIERKYFRCPKIVGDNVDLSKHLIYIAYVYSENTGSIFPTAGIQPYHCDDVVVDGDDITFSWKLSENVFQSAGFIVFKMYAKEKEDSPYTVFNTTPAIGTVLYTIGDGVESIVSEYPDIINQLLAEMEGVQEIATPEAMQNYVNAYLEENPVQGGITEEQKQQLEQNTQDITDLKSALGLPPDVKYTEEPVQLYQVPFNSFYDGSNAGSGSGASSGLFKSPVAIKITNNTGDYIKLYSGLRFSDKNIFEENKFTDFNSVRGYYFYSERVENRVENGETKIFKIDEYATEDDFKYMQIRWQATKFNNSWNLITVSAIYADSYPYYKNPEDESSILYDLQMDWKFMSRIRNVNGYLCCIVPYYPNMKYYLKGIHSKSLTNTTESCIYMFYNEIPDLIALDNLLGNNNALDGIQNIRYYENIDLSNGEYVSSVYGPKWIAFATDAVTSFKISGKEEAELESILESFLHPNVEYSAEWNQVSGLKYRNVYVSRFGNNLPRMPRSILCMPNQKYEYDGSYYRSVMQMSSSPYSGATWTCFGDSLWDYPYGYGGNDYSSDLFVSRIGRELGMKIDNRAHSGSNIYGDDEYSGITSLNGLISEVEGGTTEPPQYITFAFGANTNVKDVGTNEDTSEQTDTVYGATKYFIEKIREKFPAAVMGCVLNPYQAWNGDTSRPDSAYNAMKEVCEEYKIPYLDMRTESGITLDMMKEGDGIHTKTVQTQTLYYHAVRRFIIGL